MKRTLIVLILSLMGFVNMAQEKQTRRELRKIEQEIAAQKIDSILQSTNYKFVARTAIPMQWQSIHIAPGYNLKVKNNQLNCHLPYYGRAYRANLSPSQGGIILDSEIQEYKVETNEKRHTIKFNARDKNDTYRFIFRISKNGNATLSVNSNNRQQINFNGYIEGL